MKTLTSLQSLLKLTSEKIDLYLEEEVSVSSSFLNILKDEKEIIILSGDKEVNVEKFARSIGVDTISFKQISRSKS